MKLKSGDPLGMKTFIISIHKKANEMKTSSDGQTQMSNIMSFSCGSQIRGLGKSSGVNCKKNHARSNVIIFEHPENLVWNLFTRIALNPDYEAVRDGIKFFVKEHVVKANKAVYGKFKRAKEALNNAKGVLM